MVGETETLVATVTGSAADKSVAWTSSDEAVVTVDADGIVTAVAAGSATITATANADTKKTATVTVTVKEDADPLAAEKAAAALLEDKSVEVAFGKGEDTAVVLAAIKALAEDNDIIQALEESAIEIADGKATVTLAEGITATVTVTEAVDPTKPLVTDKAELEAALASTEVTEITLGANIDLANKGLTLNSTKTLDLAGYTITSTDSNWTIGINTTGSLIIKDTGSNGGISNTTKGGESIRSYGKLTINGGVYTTNEGYAIFMGRATCDVTINGGTFNGWFYSNGTDNGPKLTINDGTFNKQLYLAAANTITNISGGTFTPSDVSQLSAIEIDAGTLNISGGTFTNNIDTSGNISATASNNGSGNFKGVITAIKPSGSKDGAYGSAVEINISGGTFINNTTNGDAIVAANQATDNTETVTKIVVNITGGEITGNVSIYDEPNVTKSVVTVGEGVTINGLITGQTLVTDKAGLEAALLDEAVTEITVSGEIGNAEAYTVYNVDRTVTIQGADGAKVFGTFIVKAEGVTIDNLAIQNKGDLELENGKTESSTNRGGIYVFAENVTLTNNTITNGLGTEAGLSNAIQIMSPTENNPLSSYKITGNKLIGHDNEVTNWSSSGIVIAQGYTPGSIGQYVQAIVATETDYTNLLNKNTFENNKINVTHQDWSKPSDEVVLYPVDEKEEEQHTEPSIEQ